jgi:hypothetical protein
LEFVLVETWVEKRDDVRRLPRVFAVDGDSSSMDTRIQKPPL